MLWSDSSNATYRTYLQIVFYGWCQYSNVTHDQYIKPMVEYNKMIEWGVRQREEFKIIPNVMATYSYITNSKQRKW